MLSSHQDALEIGRSRPYPVNMSGTLNACDAAAVVNIRSAGRSFYGQGDTVEVGAEQHAGAVRTDRCADRRVLSAAPQRRVPRTGPVHGGNTVSEAAEPSRLGASALVGLRHHLRPRASQFPVGQIV